MCWGCTHDALELSLWLSQKPQKCDPWSECPGEERPVLKNKGTTHLGSPLALTGLCLS